MTRSIVFGLVLLGAPGSRAAPNAEFQVIVHPDNPVAELTAAELAQLFLRTRRSWDHGTPVKPVDQATGSKVREIFTRAILGKSIGEVKQYWQQQIFSGRDVPPSEQRSDTLVVAFVSANPGAIGYVAADTPLGSVKAVAVAK